MTEDKDEPLLFVGTYVGKEFRRTYVKKDGSGEGKIFGIKIKKDMRDQFGKSFTIFDNTKGFNEIAEGDMVKLGFVVEPFTNKMGQESRSHKVIWIGKTTERPQPDKVQQQQHIQEQKLALPGLSEFAANYQEAMTKANRFSEMNENHFIGTFFRHNGIEPELVDKLIKAFKTELMAEHPPKEMRL